LFAGRGEGIMLSSLRDAESVCWLKIKVQVLSAGIISLAGSTHTKRRLILELLLYFLLVFLSQLGKLTSGLIKASRNFCFNQSTSC